MLTYQEIVSILPWAVLLFSIILFIVIIVITSNHSLEFDKAHENLHKTHMKEMEELRENVSRASMPADVINALILLLDERIESLCGSYNQLTTYIAAHDARISYLGVLKCTEKGALIPKEWGIDEIGRDIENDSIAIRNMKLDHYISILQSSREQNWATYGWMACQIEKYAQAKMDLLGIAPKRREGHMKAE